MVDLAGNETQVSKDISVIINILNKDLISIIPESDGTLTVSGGEGATRPGIEVSVFAGGFNNKLVTSDSNGGFSANLLSFDQVTVTATDNILGRTESEVFDYNIDTTLSGVVKDVNKNPLSGVTVRILGFSHAAVTDSTGTFRITEPPTGDKTIQFDGTTIPVDVSGPNKKFSTVNISVSIGTTQLNVLEDPIYLAPLLFDGSETEIESGAGVIVTSPHAPGVELDIPANANVARARGMSYYDFIMTVRTGGEWDYKQYGRIFEDLGNYNYGLTGRAVGIPGGILLRGAGAYQVILGTSSFDFGIPFFKSPFGDDPSDQEMIIRGIYDYDKNF